MRITLARPPASGVAGLLRMLTSAQTNPELANTIGNGQEVVLEGSGTRYTLEHVHAGGRSATLRRAVPKPKGKAARKAARVARRSQGLL